jgi:phosphohistidine phosphatase
MVKRLFLLRHAEAPRKQGDTDRQRKLNGKGKKESISVGSYMFSRKYKPELTISSDSPRTIETVEIVNSVLKANKAIFTVDLYNASSHQVLEIIEHSLDDINNLMIVGHNPSITSVLDLLDAKATRDDLIKSRNYEFTGKLVVVDSDARCWNEISNANNNIVDVYFPIIE